MGLVQIAQSVLPAALAHVGKDIQSSMHLINTMEASSIESMEKAVS